LKRQNTTELRGTPVERVAEKWGQKAATLKFTVVGADIPKT